MSQAQEKLVQARTTFAYVLTRVLDTPFWAVFNMLPFILYKDLHATPLQLAALITLKPLVSIFSSYWSVNVYERRERLVNNIIYARLLGYLPFFFFPFFDNAWFFIASFALYMLLAVGIVPAWMELLKLNIPEVKREKVFAYTQMFGYMGGGLLPFALGWFLDSYSTGWRWIFPLTAFISLIALFPQRKILLNSQDLINSTPLEKSTWKGKLAKPWSSAWNLLKERPDFRNYQLSFMALGAGLMIIQPVLPVFFVDVLNLSYMELSIALSLCKGVGFALTSPFWARWLSKGNVFLISSTLAALAFLFPLGLLTAESHLWALYLGYIAYGIMQSGNELTWNLSGTIFSKNRDSSPYTTLNVAAVGLRGCFVPALGSLIAASAGSASVMWVGMSLCLCSCFLFLAFYNSKRTDAEADLLNFN